MKKDFRADLNFLRAIAVLAVVLFHFKVSWLAGGFVGVDIFFVISGYLMTKIIVSGLGNSNFSLFSFYLARAKRIIPALGVVCLVLLILGWLILLPSEYRLLAKHSAASIAFMSNYIFMGESGYFDTSSHGKWLLHTWSLSIEWQFYIIFPLLLVILYRFIDLVKFKLFLVLLTFSSFGYMLYLFSNEDKSLYFGLLGRSWQMISGGVVFLFPYIIKGTKQKILFYTGLILIIGSILFIDSSYAWPSLYTLLPVLGTIMVLYANYNQGPLIKNKAMAFIGTISYSIYLWHWPIVVAATFFGFLYSPIVIVLGIIVSIILGYFSYHFIESPFGKYRASLSPSLLVIGVFSSVVFSLSCVVFFNNGFATEQRFTNAVLKADAQYLSREPRKEQCLVTKGAVSNHCIYGNHENGVAVILFGDSHASTLVSSLAQAYRNKGNVLFIAKAGCLTLPEVYRQGNNDPSCAKFVTDELEFILRNYAGIPIVVANRWSYYIKGKVGNESAIVRFNQEELNVNNFSNQFESRLISMLCYLQQTNNVFVVKPIPEFTKELPNIVAKNLLEGGNGDIFISREQYKSRNNIANKALDKATSTCGINILDPATYLCNDEICIGSEKGMPLYYDDNHLSELGNKKLISMFKSVF